MSKTIILILALYFPVLAFSQNGYLVLKKKKRQVRYFWTDSRITFQRSDGDWIHGIITNIKNDSFFLTREIVQFTINGIDTMHLRGYVFSVKDVVALPTRKELIVFDNNGRVRVILGHEKFVWVRNGWLFKVLGAGYVGLNVANDLIRNEPPFQQKKLKGLGIGAGAFVVGTIMHWCFYPHIRIGKKFHLEAVAISGKGPGE